MAATSTKETVQKYFTAIHGGGWESLIADDFVFINSNFDNVARGKAAYVTGAGRFFGLTTSVELKDLMVDGDKACVTARYALRSPKGSKSVCDVAEILSVKDGKIRSNAIFFDTDALQKFMAQG